MTRVEKSPAFPLYGKDAWSPPSGRSRPDQIFLSPKVRGTRWISIEDCDLHRVPQFAGVYIFMTNGTVLYVGSSTNLRYRLAAHNVRLSYSNSFITPWGMFPRIELKLKPSRRIGEWLFDEYRLIARLRPEFNKAGLRRCRR